MFSQVYLVLIFLFPSSAVDLRQPGRRRGHRGRKRKLIPLSVRPSFPWHLAYIIPSTLRIPHHPASASFSSSFLFFPSFLSSSVVFLVTVINPARDLSVGREVEGSFFLWGEGEGRECHSSASELISVCVCRRGQVLNSKFCLLHLYILYVHRSRSWSVCHTHYAQLQFFISVL